MPLVLIFGHVINIALNLLGTFVHTSRLQYIEFFGKFYVDGGRQFKPLAVHPAYTGIAADEIN
jgi:V/A-type H+-transporting ATPase subunit I